MASIAARSANGHGSNDRHAATNVAALIRALLPAWNSALSPAHRVVWTGPEDSRLVVLLDEAMFAEKLWRFWECAERNPAADATFGISLERMGGEGVRPGATTAVVRVRDGGVSSTTHRVRSPTSTACSATYHAEDWLLPPARGLSIVRLAGGQQMLSWYFPAAAI